MFSMFLLLSLLIIITLEDFYIIKKLNIILYFFRKLNFLIKTGDTSVIDDDIWGDLYE